MKNTSSGKMVETFTHDEAKRLNIPTAELSTVARKDDLKPMEVSYKRRDPDLDPQLIWRGKYDAAGMEEREGQHQYQCGYHQNTLDKVRYAHGHKAAQKGVNHDYGRSKDNHRDYVGIKDIAEKFSEGKKLSAHINREKYQAGKSRYGQEYPFFVMETFAEKFGERNGVVRYLRIRSEPFCHKNPVYPGTDEKTQRGPERLTVAGKISHSRQPHEEPARHIRRFGGYGRKPGSKPTLCQEVFFRVGVAPPGAPDSDDNHRHQIRANADKPLDVVKSHNFLLTFR
jgi:hypothetical protein